MRITPTRSMPCNEPRPPRSWRRGSNRETVLRVGRMLDLAEYKRRQAAPGVKVTLRNFERDRRYPIVNRFRDHGTPLPQPDASVLAAPAALKTEAFDF